MPTNTLAHTTPHVHPKPRAQIEGAELLWVDSLGCFMCAAVAGGGERVVRVRFPRRVGDEREARSALTMLAQVAWERERTYVPVMPAPAAQEAAPAAE